MRTILATAMLFMSIATFGQDLNEQEVDTTYKDTTSIVGIEVQPEFPGGLKKMFKYIEKQFDKKDTLCGNGRVFVKFIVDRQGVIRDPYVSIGYRTDCDSIALRIVQGMPRWKPGKDNGLAVNCWHTVPIYFPAKEEE